MEHKSTGADKPVARRYKVVFHDGDRVSSHEVTADNWLISERGTLFMSLDQVDVFTANAATWKILIKLDDPK